MNEDASRFKQIRSVAEGFRGVPRSERREKVIERVALPDLRDELPAVKENAIGKYFSEFEVFDPDSRVLVIAPHSQEPSAREAATTLIKIFPGRSKDEVAKLYKSWRENFISSEYSILDPKI